MLTTPILVIIFNRSDFAQRVYTMLETVQPARLYVISDGARNPEEETEVLKSRRIFQHIKWDCEVHYNFSDTNLGLFKRISEGITWAFENEEQLIILEDDCIPNPDFFRYCENMLSIYKNEPRIMTINGCNLNPAITSKLEFPFFFSRYANSWGWATWKRAWKLFDKNLDGLSDPQANENFSKDLPSSKRSRYYWLFMLNRVKNKHIDSWAYRWMFSLWVNKGLAVVPRTNLIQNIGNDNRSTNTKGNLHYLNIKTNTLHLKDNTEVPLIANEDYDQWLEDTIYSKTTKNRLMWLIGKLNK